MKILGMIVSPPQLKIKQLIFNKALYILKSVVFLIVNTKKNTGDNLRIIVLEKILEVN